MKQAAAKVFLIGAGPGDPLLLTLKARDVLRSCDCVIYDALVNPEILQFANPRAERIYAGKRAGFHCLRQNQINNLLIERAKQGKQVARLKGGDPFIFGRGGEEAEALAAAGIPLEVIPGVSSAYAVPAYAGIPVTHRGVTVTFFPPLATPNPLLPQEAEALRELVAAVSRAAG